ncbi:hypothetical protein GOBAR_AA39248 [Gossypium barbadense]|uniref:BLOC-1-related complex subunit 7 n=1 Tax=Gossypium barbadense TaxID=3634 RepID=A0A2P5VRM3_GOSBA|nr:hypothetical protein GOBAR_AA39248 [Gossypium barbadense]
MATAGRGGRTVTGTNSREGTAKSTVNEQISQAVLSTSNLLHLMQQSSPSRTQLMKLPKNLLAKTPTIKNTGQMLELMPRAISSLDAHIDNGLQSEPVLLARKLLSCCVIVDYMSGKKVCVPHLKTVIQLLENMESSQLSSLSQSRLSRAESQQAHQYPEVGSPP